MEQVNKKEEKDTVSGISKIIPFRSDDPNTKSVIITKKIKVKNEKNENNQDKKRFDLHNYKNHVGNYTEINEEVEYNISEYMYNEYKLYDIAKNIIKRTNQAEYYELVEEQKDRLRRKYERGDIYSEPLNEEDQKLYNQYFEEHSKLQDTLYEPEDFQRYMELSQKMENLKKPKDMKRVKIHFDNYMVEYHENALQGEFSEARKLFMAKEKDLYRQLMRWRESRLLPTFKNSVDILVQKYKQTKEKVKLPEEEKNNMIMKLYNLFHELYTKQLNDKVKINKKIMEKVNRELESLKINSVEEIDPDDLITINGCPYHHKFVNEKLTSYRRIYIEEAEKLGCNPSETKFTVNDYKNNLIKEYLMQQGRGLTAPLPLTPFDPTNEPKEHLKFLIHEIETSDPLDEPDTFIISEIEDLFYVLSDKLDKDTKEEYVKKLREYESRITKVKHNQPPTIESILNTNPTEVSEVVNNKPETEIIDSKMPTNIFNKTIIREKIIVPFKNIGKNIESYFIKYAKEKIEGRCRNEGYVRNNSCKVITHTSGIVQGTNVLYNVVFLCDVCIPYHNMEVECYVKNIVKLGIRAVLTDIDNPMSIYISKEHHKYDLDNYQIEEGDKLTVTIVGYHYENNDPYISAFGILSEINIPHKYINNGE